MLRKSPNLETFYNGLNPTARLMVNSSANEALLSKFDKFLMKYFPFTKNAKLNNEKPMIFQK